MLNGVHLGANRTLCPAHRRDTRPAAATIAPQRACRPGHAQSLPVTVPCAAHCGLPPACRLAPAPQALGLRPCRSASACGRSPARAPPAQCVLFQPVSAFVCHVGVSPWPLASIGAACACVGTLAPALGMASRRLSAGTAQGCRPPVPQRAASRACRPFHRLQVCGLVARVVGRSARCRHPKKPAATQVVPCGHRPGWRRATASACGAASVLSPPDSFTPRTLRAARTNNGGARQGH